MLHLEVSSIGFVFRNPWALRNGRTNVPSRSRKQRGGTSEDKASSERTDRFRLDHSNRTRQKNLLNCVDLLCEEIEKTLRRKVTRISDRTLSFLESEGAFTDRPENA